MTVFFRMITHLAPRARAWTVTITKNLRKFFEGLAAGVSAPIKAFADAVWLDLFSQTTRDVNSWEWQFGLKTVGLTEQERRDRLDAVWQALSGGQSPRYVQDTIQSHGFDVYVHEWWVPGSGPPPVARDPASLPYLVMLVNKLYTIEPVLTCECGEPLMECGEPLAECGQYSGFDFNRVIFAIPAGDPEYIVYIGGQIFGTVAVVPTARKEEFEDLCLKYVPYEQWIGLIVVFGIVQLLVDGDMEDASPLVDFEAGLTGQLMPDGSMEA